jgi:hypothetical protein
MGDTLSLTVLILGILLAVFAAASFESLLKGCFELRHSLRATSYDFGAVLLKSTLVPGVSMIFVAPDASPESRARVRRLLDLHFGKHEVVLVVDSPGSAGLDVWVREFHLCRHERPMSDIRSTAHIRGCYISTDPIRLLVVDKEGAGMTDALNAGVNFAQYPVIGLVDAEADFIPEFLLRLIRPMLAGWDHTMAVCGIAPPQPLSNLPGSIGTLEFLRMWLSRCAAFSAWNKLLPVPGACMLVKREAIRAVGGFRGGATRLFFDLHAAASGKTPRQQVAFVATPVSVRPAAATWEDLRRQARNDQRQLGAALWRVGLTGGREFFGLLCIRGLRPLVETAAILLAGVGSIVGLVHPALLAAVLVISAGGGIVNSVAAVVLRELAEPSGTAPAALGMLCLRAIPENLGYRQWRNLWLIAGFFGAIRGEKVLPVAP